MTPLAASRHEATGVALVVARVEGDHQVHLVATSSPHALCGQPTRTRPPRKSFRESGCHGCLDAALAAGQVAAMEGDRSWINLRRLESASA